MSNPEFFDSVFQVARLIPYGRVTSYGAIARYIGSPRAGRMVGFAMNGSASQKEYVPAHRVVNRLGILSGKRFFGGPNTMQELLESEGVLIKEDQIQNFEQVFWDPNIELRLD
jgi:methylated-DNA-protein-cysteine methyltransferase-like protein